MSDADQPPTIEDLPALYARAVETGEAAELVEALLRVHGINLRGLAELTGVSHRTLAAWGRSERRAAERTLRDLRPLLSPSKRKAERIGRVRERFPRGLRGRPRKPGRTS